MPSGPWNFRTPQPFFQRLTLAGSLVNCWLGGHLWLGIKQPGGEMQTWFIIIFFTWKYFLGACLNIWIKHSGLLKKQNWQKKKGSLVVSGPLPKRSDDTPLCDRVHVKVSGKSWLLVNLKCLENSHPTGSGHLLDTLGMESRLSIFKCTAEKIWW